MRILFVTSHWPHAPSYGAQLRTLHVGRLLQRIGHVSLIVASPDDADDDTIRKTENEFDLLDANSLEPHTITLAERFRCEFDPAFMNTHYRITSPRARERVLAAMADHDVAWVFGVHLANAFGVYRWPHTILDLDDVPSQVYEARVQAASGALEALRGRRMARVWRRRERRFADRFDVVTVCTEESRRRLDSSLPIHVVPNGFAPSDVPPVRRAAAPGRLGFIGLCEYGPNRDGLEWFIRGVWPEIRRAAPHTRLRIVGKGSDVFNNRDHGIDALGPLDDAADEIASWSAMIVPIRFGGGTRIKIAEAFCRRCPVVSTSFGAHGYDVDDGSVLIGDDQQEFGNACLRALRDPALRNQLADNGWRQFTRKWSWDVIGGAVAAAVETCLERTPQKKGSGRVLRNS